MDYIAWTEKWATGQRWFARLRAKKGSPHSTLKGYALSLYRFAEFRGKNPDEIFAEYKAAAKEDLDETLDKIETDLDLFVNWQCDKYHNTRATAVQKRISVQSWLKNNAKSLKGIPTPETYTEEIPPIPMEDLRELLHGLSERERFFTLFIAESGMSRTEAVKIAYGDIREQFERDEQFINIKLVRVKEHVKYETFIGPNAVKALKAWLRIRKLHGEEINDDSKLFTSNVKPYEPLSARGLTLLYTRIMVRTGINVKPHKLRKFFETYMSLGKIHPIILKYWMGHKVKTGKSDIEGKYIIPPTNEQLKLYMVAYKNIDVTPQRDEFELFVAETKARMQGMNPEQQRRMIKDLATRRPGLMEHPAIKRILEESTKAGDLPAEPNFKEIGESELLVHLQNGYSIVHTNSKTGKIIVKR